MYTKTNKAIQEKHSVEKHSVKKEHSKHMERHKTAIEELKHKMAAMETDHEMHKDKLQTGIKE